MSKVLSVENGNYVVKVESGQNIILDTSRGQVNSNGDLLGEVIINGSLQVRGTTTTVNSRDTNILDNIIVLNKYEDPGDIGGILKDGTSGIEVDRGDLRSRVSWIFNENISWTMGGISNYGSWMSYDAGFDAPTPIYVGGIKTPGSLFVDCGNEVITVTNNVQYETKIFEYDLSGIVDNGNRGIIDDDNIPNAKAVVDYIEYAFNTIGTQSGIENYDTEVRAFDSELDSSESRVECTIDGNTRVFVYDNRTIINTLKFSGNVISPLNVDTDLELEAPGVATVKIKDVLELTETPHADDIKVDPFAPTEGIKIYSKTPSTGNTGLYFVNKNNINDELISKNRSILYSMLF